MLTWLLSAQPAEPGPGPRRVVLNGLNVPLDEVVLTDELGADLSDRLQPQEVDGAVTVLAPARPFQIRPRHVALLKPGADERLTLPGGLAVPLGAPPGKFGWYRLTCLATPLPAPWNGETGRYQTRLIFALTRTDGPAGGTAGRTHEQAVDLSFRVLHEAPRVEVRADFSQADLHLQAVPRLELRPQRLRPLGLGLEEVALTVASVWPHGEQRPATDGSTVTFAVDGAASVQPAAVTLPAGEATVTVQLRTGGLGPILVRADGLGTSGTVEVHQRAPLAAGSSALLGGALGGYARRFMKGARRRTMGRRTIEGVVVGVIAFAAATFGLVQFGLSPALVVTEAGAFLTAALAGFVGVALLERLVRPAAAAGSARSRR